MTRRERIERSPQRKAIASLFHVERQGRKGAIWFLAATFADNVEVPEGYRVDHCGHPTANRPYTGYTPSGEIIYAPNGLAFQYLHDAQLAVVERAIKDRK